MSPADAPAPDAVHEEIAPEIARVHFESYGERATNIKVAFAPRLVAVVMDIDLAAGEQTLLGAGKSVSVRLAREAYQEVIEGVFIAIVERATGHRVVGFASRTVLDEPVAWSAEIFRLAEPGVSRPDPR